MTSEWDLVTLNGKMQLNLAILINHLIICFFEYGFIMIR